MTRLLKWCYDKIPIKFELYRFLKKFWTPSPRVYRHLHFQGQIEVSGPGCRFLMQHYGYELENALFWEGLTGGWEKISMDLWLKLCRDSQVILDVGANTGVYALAAKAVNPQAQVHAFEPVCRIFDKLRLNCRMNNFDIQIYPEALSDFDGEATIYDPPTEHVYSVTVNKNLSAPGTPVIPTKIRTMRLDTLIRARSLKRVDLIKIDVETHEPQVLRGMGEFLDSMKPAMLVEVLNASAGQEIEDFLRGKDYLYFSIDEVHTPLLVDRIAESPYRNYLFCDTDTAKRLGLRT